MPLAFAHKMKLEAIFADSAVNFVFQRVKGIEVCSDEERSAFYEQLMAAEEAGKKNKKGLHSAKEAPVHHANDVSLPGTANRYSSLLHLG